ncbi:MAG: hypothetical protein QOD43_126 [Gaiellaceae bacterium]|nr:hypothetical protein [Gaiellaceae bacterium]
MAVVIVLALAAAVVMVYRTLSGSQVPGKNPLTTIFASRLMIATARLAILAFGLFVVLSVLVHMRRGQWLTAAGPFKVTLAARTLTRSLPLRLAQTRLVEADRERLRARVSL